MELEEEEEEKEEEKREKGREGGRKGLGTRYSSQGHNPKDQFLQLGSTSYNFQLPVVHSSMNASVDLSVDEDRALVI